ncbi:MAG: TRAP transporter large permease [Dehalococcoidales bacterium]|nr:TRAP transporter large permease [Dehalococcoidales bacterium]
MTPEIIGLIGIGVLLLLFIISVPVGFAMAIVGLAGFCYLVSPAAGLSLLARDFFDTFANYNLTVIPFFMLMGALAYSSGMSSRLYDASYKMFGSMKGGLAISTIAGCAGFAAICGSTSATVAAMGRVALPEMRRYKYDDALSTGCVAAAGSLGILIPPSSIFIVYGILTEQSIGQLFIAGVLPGAMLAVLFAIAVIIVVRIKPGLAPAGQPTTIKEKIAGLGGVIEMVVLFLLVMAGLFLGWFSAMQAGAIGAAGALIIGLVRRKLAWNGFTAAIKDTLKITCQVMVIVAGAFVFGHFMAVTKIPISLANWIGGLSLPPMVVMGIIILMYLIGGCFMDSLALITLTIPIIYPVVIALGFDPIWFGVVIVLVTEMGVITPPVGINVYVIKGIAKDVPLETIFKGISPFLAAMIVAAIILVFFPQIATFLPNMAGP